ncbi:hypothetical protein CH252_19040 [Rhodococcus sp. 06-1477-1B]|nr:hypothetical protein CH252_19040 [Rhodococcus sp. 06-1477-1B]
MTNPNTPTRRDADLDVLRRSLHATGLDWADAGDEGLSDDAFYTAAGVALDALAQARRREGTPAVREARQTLRDYLGMASGGTLSDADLWLFADEALSDLTEIRSESAPTAAEIDAGAWAILNRNMDLADRSPSQDAREDARLDARAALEAARSRA